MEGTSGELGPGGGGGVGARGRRSRQRALVLCSGAETPWRRIGQRREAAPQA